MALDRDVVITRPETPVLRAGWSLLLLLVSVVGALTAVELMAAGPAYRWPAVFMTFFVALTAATFIRTLARIRVRASDIHLDFACHSSRLSRAAIAGCKLWYLSSSSFMVLIVHRSDRSMPTVACISGIGRDAAYKLAADLRSLFPALHSAAHEGPLAGFATAAATPNPDRIEITAIRRPFFRAGWGLGDLLAVAVLAYFAFSAWSLSAYLAAACAALALLSLVDFIFCVAAIEADSQRVRIVYSLHERRVSRCSVQYLKVVRIGRSVRFLIKVRGIPIPLIGRFFRAFPAMGDMALPVPTKTARDLGDDLRRMLESSRS
jgi:hypothetical protein